jgi:hypothetical protein
MDDPVAAPDTASDREPTPPVQQRQPVPADMLARSTMVHPGYVDMFTLAGGGPGRSAEPGARAMFDDAAGRGGQFIWRVILGLRLRSAPDRVAGWALAGGGEDWVRLEATSWFMTGHLVVQAAPEQVSFATFINYDRWLAARLWPPLSKKHRQLSPGLLKRAYRTQRALILAPDL